MEVTSSVDCADSHCDELTMSSLPPSDVPPFAGAEDGGSGLDGVVNRIKDLAINRGDAMRRSKKDRASLKSSFREYHKAIEVRGLANLSGCGHL